MKKKPVVVFTTADKNNYQYAVMLLNSLRKFHDWPVILVTDEKDPEKLKQLPKDVEVKDLEPYIKIDPNFFYRQKPILGEEYIKDYELVLGLDSDQIITGSLDYILETKDYDVGTVINWNRTDPKEYGAVQGWGILPVEYMNCGLVAMRNEKFVHDWKVLCFSNQFERMKYKEQDLLNAMIYFGNWNVRCFDHFDGPASYTAWHGLLAKGEWNRAVLKDDTIVIPKGEGTSPFPDRDVELKVIHFAGGQGSTKMNYKTRFNDEVSERIDYLVASK